MLLVLLVAGTLAAGDVSPPPGEGVSLLPGPEPITHPAPRRPSPRLPAPAAPVSVAAAGAAVLRRRWMRSAAPPGGPGPPPEVTLVLVGGYGSEGSADFAELVGMMGVSPTRVRSFDYRWMAVTEEGRAATRRTEVEELASTLNAYLAGLTDGGQVYLVGHSKGGAVIAELVARWDRFPDLRPAGVVGAALLDPPLADGPLGLLQSLGTPLGLPNDGGYDPRAWPGAPDRRSELGRDSGVPVVVFRNPKAAVTNFWARPAGLRVFDVPDAGPHALAVLARPDPVPGRRWLRFMTRVREAHESVLTDRRVADCLVAEMRSAGSCRELPARAARDW